MNTERPGFARGFSEDGMYEFMVTDFPAYRKITVVYDMGDVVAELDVPYADTLSGSVSLTGWGSIFPPAGPGFKMSFSSSEEYPLLTQAQIDGFAKKSDIPPKPVINKLAVPDGGVLDFGDCGAGKMFVVTTGWSFTLAPQHVLVGYANIPTSAVTHCAVYTVDGANFINTGWSAPR